MKYQCPYCKETSREKLVIVKGGKRLACDSCGGKSTLDEPDYEDPVIWRDYPDGKPSARMWQ